MRVFKVQLVKGGKLAKQGFDKAKEGFGTVFNKAKEAFTPSEEFKNRLKSLNPFPKIREGLKGLKLSNPFTGLGQKIETSSLFKGALPEGREHFLENQLPLSKGF